MVPSSIERRTCSGFVPLGALLLLGLATCGCTGTDSASESGPGTVASTDKENAATLRTPSSLPATPSSDEPVHFDELSPNALAEVTYQNGSDAELSSIVESLGGGIGLADFDGDGLLDIFVPGGGGFDVTNKLVMPRSNFVLRGVSRGDWKRAEVNCRAEQARHYSHGVAIVDFNNDGFSDFLLTGYGGVQLFHNQGDGTFLDVTDDCGLNDRLWSSSAAWGDFNSDGNNDLYICHYVDWTFENHPICPGPTDKDREICSPRDFSGLPDSLYLSDGSGAFLEQSEEWGLNKGGKGLGVVVGEMTGDQFIDVYVGNDTTENFLYRNTGAHFEEIAMDAGVAMDDEGIPNGSMGVDLADFNGDLRPDLWAANYERESFALYRNEGNGLYLHVSRPTGITALGGLYVGFGTSFLDCDADGDLDVVVSNGHVIKYPQFATRKQQPILLLNNKGRFARASFPASHYFSQLHEGRGLARGDLDGDGHMDVVFSRINAPPAMLVSKLPASTRSLSVELIGVESNRDGIGSTVKLECDQGTLLRNLNGGGSYLSSNQPRILFEVPEGWKPNRLTVNWPNGRQQELDSIDFTTEVQRVVEESKVE